MMTYQIKRTCQEENYKNILLEVSIDNEIIGNASIMVSGSEAYIERLDIDEKYQNLGYGTQAVKYISNLYDYTYTAPDNPDSQRLFEKIGNEMSKQKYDEVGAYVDQGFGVYEL